MHAETKQMESFNVDPMFNIFFFRNTVFEGL